MSRYLFAMTDAGGNVPPEISVARGPAERGHDITILGDPTIAEEAAAIGVRFQTWQDARQRMSRRREDDLIRDYELRTPAQQVGLMREILFGWAPGATSRARRRPARTLPRRLQACACDRRAGSRPRPEHEEALVDGRMDVRRGHATAGADEEMRHEHLLGMLPPVREDDDALAVSNTGRGAASIRDRSNHGRSRKATASAAVGACDEIK